MRQDKYQFLNERFHHLKNYQCRLALPGPSSGAFVLCNRELPHKIEILSSWNETNLADQIVSSCRLYHDFFLSPRPRGAWRWHMCIRRSWRTGDKPFTHRPGQAPIKRLFHTTSWKTRLNILAERGERGLLILALPLRR